MTKAPTVKLHWAERFMNWFPFNTKLYIRGERGKSQKEVNKLHNDLFHQLAPFLEKLKKEAYREGYEDGFEDGGKTVGYDMGYLRSLELKKKY